MCTGTSQTCSENQAGNCEVLHALGGCSCGTSGVGDWRLSKSKLPTLYRAV